MQTKSPLGRFTGALTIARYNWPFYAGAMIAVVLGTLFTVLPILPLELRYGMAIGSAIAGWLAIASFIASHWVFDRSEVTRWRWLANEFPTAPRTWVHINAGLEETQAPLPEIFPGTEGKVLDIYDPESMTEPAIARAREMKGTCSAIAAKSEALPIESDWAEAVFLLMTAHEIRSPKQREVFFLELARILSPTGKIIVVEHLRDWANALAFGPGVFHFLPRKEWLRLATVSHLAVVQERSFTPFVRVFVYEPLTSI